MFDYIPNVAIYIYIYIYVFALTPREKQLPKFLPIVFPVGVVVRFRKVVAENITLRPYGQHLLKLFCPWDRKSLEHTVSSYFGY